MTRITPPSGGGSTDISGKFDKTGGTITGDVVISKSAAQLTLQSPSDDESVSAGVALLEGNGQYGFNTLYSGTVNTLYFRAIESGTVARTPFEIYRAGGAKSIGNFTVDGDISATNLSGTNTGDQTLPVKATSAELVTGTDDAKFATALGLVPYLNNSMARQAIINGNFDIWQRGITLDVSAELNLLRLADQWIDYGEDDGGTFPTKTRTRETFTVGELSNSFYFSRLTVNGAGTSLGANSYSRYSNRIEFGVRNLCGLNKKVTLSFWARSSITNKKICPILQQNYGSGGSPTTQETIIGTPITLTSTLTKYTVTFTTNTLVGKTFGTNNNDFVQIGILSQWGSTVFGGISGGAETFVGAGTIDIAQVQLCAGEVALPFMPESFEETLRKCQRYYEKSFDYAVAPSDNAGVLGALAMTCSATGSYNPLGTVKYCVKKRTAVTPTLYNPSAVDASNKIRSSAGTNHPASTDCRGEGGFTCYVNNSSTTAGNILTVHWTAEAEL